MTEKVDLALAQDLKLYFREAGEPPAAVIEQVKFDLGQAVNLEEGIGKSAKPHVRQQILDELSRAVYCATDFYDIYPSPAFGLTYPWGEKPPKNHVSTNGKGYVIATADMNCDFPEGIICFAPIYFEALADYKTGRISNTSEWGVDYPPVEVGGHEVDHLDKFIIARDDMQRDLAVFATEGLEGWAETPTEKFARKFGRAFNLEYKAHLAKAAVVFDAKNPNI